MKRVAFFSPLPPETSGIADYSAELAPALAAHCELELFTADPSACDPALTARFAVRPYDAFTARDRAGAYEAVLYQIGNSAAHHGVIYRQLLARPGIVVLHEFMLHHLVRDLALAGPGRLEFVEAMRYCYGRTGRAMAGRLLHANNLPEAWRYPLFERVVDAAQSLIVHSRTTRDRVLASRPTARVTVVPHHLSLHGCGAADRAERHRLLAALDLADDAFLVASFGHLTAAKHLDVSLAAFARLRHTHPQAVYLLAGEISHAYPELAEMLAGDLGAGVLTTGRVPLARLLELMQHCDVAINLRHPTGGETSGACLRLLGLGRPVIASDVGWFSEIPPHCCAQVAPGGGEVEEIAALLSALADDESLRRELGANAAQWASDHHRLEDSARGYAEVIAATIEGAGEPYHPVPPLAPAPAGDVTSRLIADVTAGLVELGLGEEDHQAQRLLAASLVDLDLDHRAEPA